jgi:hypothetical protein
MPRPHCYVMVSRKPTGVELVEVPASRSRPGLNSLKFRPAGSRPGLNSLKFRPAEADRGWTRWSSGQHEADRGWTRWSSGQQEADRGWNRWSSGQQEADQGWGARETRITALQSKIQYEHPFSWPHFRLIHDELVAGCRTALQEKAVTSIPPQSCRCLLRNSCHPLRESCHPLWDFLAALRHRMQEALPHNSPPAQGLPGRSKV